MPRKEQDEKSVPKLRLLKPTDKKEKCGICGSTTKKLTKTACCSNWICDDYGDYQMLSYARNSCARNHDRYTMCAAHYHEKHKGADWRECSECRDHCETEMYVYFSTNEFNFVKLAKPPKFKPTHCNGCNRIIRLSKESYIQSGGGYYCVECGSKDI